MSEKYRAVGKVFQFYGFRLFLELRQIAYEFLRLSFRVLCVEGDGMGEKCRAVGKVFQFYMVLGYFWNCGR